MTRKSFAWRVIKWRNIEALLLEYYDVGKSKEGADAYPPLMLLKCMLLQKWFRIQSDPELETQINDRTSFKTFLNLSLDEPSPDHSTFSRFRSRLSKEAMIHLNNVVLQELARRGLSINEGIPAGSDDPLGRRAVDTRSHRNLFFSLCIQFTQ